MQKRVMPPLKKVNLIKKLKVINKKQMSERQHYHKAAI